jgi:hypothetical protein
MYIFGNVVINLLFYVLCGYFSLCRGSIFSGKFIANARHAIRVGHGVPISIGQHRAWHPSRMYHAHVLIAPLPRRASYVV